MQKRTGGFDEGSGGGEDPGREHEEERRKQRQNWLALAFVAVLLLAGGWLFLKMLDNARIQNCIESGRRNCMPLELPAAPPR